MLEYSNCKRNDERDQGGSHGTVESSVRHQCFQVCADEYVELAILQFTRVIFSDLELVQLCMHVFRSGAFSPGIDRLFSDFQGTYHLIKHVEAAVEHELLDYVWLFD